MATETATPTEPVEPLDPVLSSMRSEIQLLIDKDFTTGEYGMNFKVSCTDYTTDIIEKQPYSMMMQNLYMIFA